MIGTVKKGGGDCSGFIGSEEGFGRECWLVVSCTTSNHGFWKHGSEEEIFNGTRRGRVYAGYRKTCFSFD